MLQKYGAEKNIFNVWKLQGRGFQSNLRKKFLKCNTDQCRYGLRHSSVSPSPGSFQIKDVLEMGSTCWKCDNEHFSLKREIAWFISKRTVILWVAQENEGAPWNFQETGEKTFHRIWHWVSVIQLRSRRKVTAQSHFPLFSLNYKEQNTHLAVYISKACWLWGEP